MRSGFAVNINGANRDIYLNDTQKIDHSAQCNQRVGLDDLLFGSPCAPIPNDSLIYVCQGACIADSATNRFDAFWQSDPPLAVPQVIKECKTEGLTGGAPGTYTLKSPAPHSSTDTLQLRYVEGEKVSPQAIPWLSPWCKPAIYLYPTQKTATSVNVNTVGKMTLTIPKYPAGGWQVTAFPDGKIESLDGNFDYLYYEAEIPDEKIDKPTQGFVRKYSEIENLLKEILPKLGLNQKESYQFMSYWMEVLPKEAPYYFVGIVSPQNLDQIAPLNITPSPDKLIRVTIYFQVLDGPLDVASPQIITPQRSGFTVVEWGGIFKKNPKYPFSCLM